MGSARDWLLLAPALVLLAAPGCGSADSSDLLTSGSPSSSTGGAGSGSAAGSGGTTSTGGGAGGTATGGSGGASVATGGATTSGGFTGSGGATTSGGFTGSGGFAGSGGFTAAGGFTPAGGTAGVGGAPTQLLVGGLVTPQCITCAEAQCSIQMSACVADATCYETYRCLATCSLAACAQCIFAGARNAAFIAFQDCTTGACNGLCPAASGG